MLGSLYTANAHKALPRKRAPALKPPPRLALCNLLVGYIRQLGTFSQSSAEPMLKLWFQQRCTVAVTEKAVLLPHEVEVQPFQQ